MDYILNLGAWNSVFAVPCSVVDQHLKLAGALHLKVLLWCLRHAGESFQAETVAQALVASPADVRDAMRYWLESGIFCEMHGEVFPAPAPQISSSTPPPTPTIAPIPELTPDSSSPQIAPFQEEAVPAMARHAVRRFPKPDGTFVAERISHSQEVSYMMDEAQQILGRPLSPALSSSLLMLHDDYGLPGDVILMLLQYAKSRGRDQTNYIESVGCRWAEEGVTTHELVEEKLRVLDERAAAWKTVAQILGISKRSPSSREEQYAERWLKDWAFSQDMIREAYERCVDSTGKMSMSYINKILERWYKSHILTLEQAREERAEKARTDEVGRQATYNISEYERMSIHVPDEG